MAHHAHGIMSRTRKNVDEEATESLKRISSITSLLKGKKVVSNPSVEAIGFMLLSRFNKDESDLPKMREARQKVNDFEEQSVVESKSLESAHSMASSNLEKNRRYALSLATLATKENKRLQIVQDGAIAILIELSTHHDKLTQVRCASAFASLSSEASIRTRMLDEGALGVLISLATNSNIREIKSDCSKAICNLCCVPSYEFKMVKEGVPFTVLNIAAACPDTLDVCLKTLLNISCIPDKFARIEDVTEALLYFSSHNTLTLPQEILLLSALCNLSSLRNNQLRLVEDGCLKIVERYYKSKHDLLRRMSSEMLRNFTADSRSRSKLLDIDVISVIVNMSKDDLDEIRVLAAKCLYFLSKDRNFRRKIMHTSAFSLILQTCSDSSKNVILGQVASKTLRVLCSDKDLVEKLVEDGVGNALVALMLTDDTIIHQYCTESLCALFQHKMILTHLLDEGAHEMVVQLAKRTKDSTTAEWCAFALYQLTESSFCDFHIIETAVLPCILLLCENGSYLTKLYSAAALAHATLNKRIDCSDAIPLLVSLLNNRESDADIKKYCATSLFNLADDETNCQKMLAVGALAPVVKLTQSTETKVICAGIISRLSLHEQYYDQFATGDVLKVLLELSCIDDRLAQRRVVIALSNLSHSEILCSKLLLLSPISYIISLASERDEYLRRGCISIVCNMSYQPGSEKVIVAGGIVPTLMITSLITSDQVVSRIICVKALVNLMADRQLYQSMVKDGVIWGLSKLALTEDDQLQELCAKALCRLSCTFSRDLINSTVAKATVMRLLKSENLAIVRPSARILTNLLLATNETDEKFRTDMVENMHPMASNKDEELNALCVVCLCLASQSEASRISIVDSGMLNKIDPGAIFSADHRISYAYISMLNNIANNPKMRTKVLDDHMIERIEKILEAKDPALTIAAVQALYYISCAAENIPRLIDQQIISFVHFMIESEESANPVVLQHLLACLYNLTTEVETQNTLVCSGIVEVIVQLWPEVQKDQKMAKLAILAICHLACGKTNSSRIVSDGCTPLLCFICEHRKMAPFAQYTFTYDFYLRCSAALRNLLTVVGNQTRMVDEGTLPVLIQMANQSFDRLVGLTNINQLNSATPNETKLIRVNCAAALKLLTYNKELRPILVETEAITIILAEIRKESDISISQGLLKELEAESWENGARTKQKEGRSKAMPTAPLFTDFLKGNSKVDLAFEAKDVDLDKYYVQVHLEDEGERSPFGRSNSAVGFQSATSSSRGSTPDSASHPRRSSTLRASSSFRRSKLAKMVTEASMTAASQEVMNADLGIAPLKLENLKPREDIDDTVALVPQSYPKLECEVEVDAYALVRVDNADEVASVSLAEEDSMSLEKGKTPPMGLFEQSVSSRASSRGRDKGIPDVIHARGSRESSKLRKSSSQSKASTELPDINNNKPKHATKAKPADISQLLLMINQAAKHRKLDETTGQMDEVLDKWKSISRF